MIYIYIHIPLFIAYNYLLGKRGSELFLKSKTKLHFKKRKTWLLYIVMSQNQWCIILHGLQSDTADLRRHEADDGLDGVAL